MSTNALPSIQDVAAQFAGKSMVNPQLTRESAPPAEPPAETPPPSGPDKVSENAQPTGEARAEVIDAANAETEGTETPKDPLSAKFAALSRREKAHQQTVSKTQADLKAAESRIKEAEARLDARLKEIEAKDQAFSSASRPLDILKARGLTYADATQDMLGGYKPKEPDPLDERLKPFEARLSKLDAVEKELAEYKQQLASKEQESNFKTVNENIKTAIAGDGEKYQYVAQMGQQAVDLIRDVMVQSYESNGQMLSYEAACDRVEEYYEDEIVKKLLVTKKVQSRFASPAKPANPPQSPTKSTPPASKTLTADLGTGGGATIDVDKMSNKDALKYLSKQLKFKE